MLEVELDPPPALEAAPPPPTAAAPSSSSTASTAGEASGGGWPCSPLRLRTEEMDLKWNLGNHGRDGKFGIILCPSIFGFVTAPILNSIEFSSC